LFSAPRFSKNETDTFLISIREAAGIAGSVFADVSKTAGETAEIFIASFWVTFHEFHLLRAPGGTSSVITRRTPLLEKLRGSFYFKTTAIVISVDL